MCNKKLPREFFERLESLGLPGEGFDYEITNDLLSGHVVHVVNDRKSDDEDEHVFLSLKDTLWANMLKGMEIT